MTTMSMTVLQRTGSAKELEITGSATSLVHTTVKICVGVGKKAALVRALDADILWKAIEGL